MKPMSYSKFTFLIALIILNTSKAADIQIVDALGNTGLFPKSFVDQSEYLQGLQADFPNQEPYLLLEPISLVELSDLYAYSLNNFAGASLKNLTRYFVIADQLLFTESFQQTILSNIQQQLSNLPQNDPQAIQTRTIVQNLTALSQKSFDTQLLLQTTNKPHKDLNPELFQSTLQQQIKAKDTSLTQEIIYALPLIYRSPYFTSGMGKMLSQQAIMTGYLALGKDMNAWYFKLTTQHKGMVARTMNTASDLRKLLKLPFFDFDRVFSVNYDKSLDKLVFAAPGKLAVTGIPQFRKIKHSTIISLGTVNNDARCTHIAFSPDSSKLTCIIDRKPFIITIQTNKITPVDIPADIFSSMLITDNILLVRTMQGNTYAYNLVTKKLTYLPNIDIDYFTVSYQEDANKILVFGLRQDIGTSIIDNATENIDLSTIA